MGERYNGRTRAAAWILMSVGAAGLAACASEKTTLPPPPSATPSQYPNRPFPWPYCDLSHRAPAVGHSKDGPVVLVDSNCTDPADTFTGVYSAYGEPSQRTGLPIGRLANGSEVVVLCRIRDGQRISNDSGVGSTDWDRVEATAGLTLMTPVGDPATTSGGEIFVIPNTHLGFYNDTKAPVCSPRVLS